MSFSNLFNIFYQIYCKHASQITWISWWFNIIDRMAIQTQKLTETITSRLIEPSKLYCLVFYWFLAFSSRDNQYKKKIENINEILFVSVHWLSTVQYNCNRLLRLWWFSLNNSTVSLNNVQIMLSAFQIITLL